MTGLATASQGNRWVRKGSPRLHCTQHYSDPKSGSLCRTPRASQIVISRGYGWCMVSKGRIWSQSNKVVATQGSSVTLRARQGSRADCSPRPRVCCHAGILAELMPTSLTLAVLLEKGKDVSGRKTERGECLPKCTKRTHYSPILRAGPSNGISCPARVL